jgi:hypothetical protein
VVAANLVGKKVGTSMAVQIHSEKKQSFLGRATAFFVYLFEKVMPDPFVIAVITFSKR